MDSADFDALEEQARASDAGRAPSPSAAAGADDEITAAENATRWRELRLRPRVLAEAARIDYQRHGIGTPLRCRSWSRRWGAIACFMPRARSRPRGAPPRRTPSSCSPPTRPPRSRTWRRERHDAAQWFQLYLSDRAIAEGLIDRVGRGRLRRGRADRRHAGLRIEPARRAQSARRVAGHPQRQPAGRADRPQRLRQLVLRHASRIRSR